MDGSGHWSEHRRSGPEQHIRDWPTDASQTGTPAVAPPPGPAPHPGQDSKTGCAAANQNKRNSNRPLLLNNKGGARFSTLVIKMIVG